MQTADVIVVGGGPAGSTCARRLTRAGARVILIDAATFPRDKVCAGWITPRVIDTLAFDACEYGAQHTFQPLHGFRVGWVGRDEGIDVDYGRVVSAAIRRCEFDAYLLARSGAIVHEGTPVTSLRRDKDRWVVNGRWTAPVVVGAGGYSCPVARMLNGRLPPDVPLVVAREAEFVLDARSARQCLVTGQVAELYFTPDLAGYGWCVRKGEVMNVGIGRLDRRLTRGDVDAFASFVSGSRRFAAAPLDQWRGHAYLAGVPAAQRRTGDGLLLVGDAAGLASERSGEGIGPAVESGAMAAQAIVEASGQPGGLTRYDDLVNRRWPRSGPWSRVARVVPDRVTRPVARTLLRSPSFVRHVVLDRWFLHAGETADLAA